MALSGKGNTELVDEPVRLAPEMYRVRLENDLVRVLEIRFRPGETTPMHSHPPMIIYALTDCLVRFIHKDGSSQVMTIEQGQCIWSDNVTHAAENLGADEVHVLNIELKKT